MTPKDLFEDLADKAVSNALSEVELDALEEILVNDPSKQEELEARFSLDSDLQYLMGDISKISSWEFILEDRKGEFSVSPTKRKDLGDEDNESPGITNRKIGLSHRNRKRTKSKKTYWPIASMVACLILSTVLVIAYNSRTFEPSPDHKGPITGITVRTSGDLYSDGKLLVPGFKDLKPGSIVNSQQGKLSLNDGTSIVFSGSLKLPIDDSEHRWGVINGEASFAVTPRKMGDPQFQVDTGHGRIRVTGTKFWVDRRDGYSQLSVEEGNVEVEDGHGQHRVSKGERLRLSLNLWQIYAIDHAKGSSRVIAIKEDSPLRVSEFDIESINFFIEGPSEVKSVVFRFNHDFMKYAGLVPSGKPYYESRAPFSLFGDGKNGRRDLAGDLPMGEYIIDIRGRDSKNKTIAKKRMSFRVIP